jgi:hypothetical protein
MCNSNKAVCTGVGYVHSSKAVYIGRWMLRQYYQNNMRGLDLIKDARMSQSIHTLQQVLRFYHLLKVTYWHAEFPERRIHEGASWGSFFFLTDTIRRRNKS